MLKLTPRSRHLLLELLLPYKAQLLAALVALVFAAGGILTIGQGLKRVIDRGFGGADVALLNTALLALLAVIVVISVATYFRFYLVSWLGERITADLRRRVFSHLLTLSPNFFDDNRTGDVLSRLTNDTQQLQTLIGSSISMALRNALLLVGGLILLLLTSVKLTLLALAAIPVVLVPILAFGRRVRQLARASQDKVAEVGAFTDEAIHEIRTVQAYGQEHATLAAFAGTVESAFVTGIARVRQRALLICSVIGLTFTALAVILWVGGHDVLAGTLSAGDLSAFIFYAVVVAGAVATIAEVIGEVQRAAGATERLLELLATPAEISSPAAPVPLPDRVRGAITFENVGFAYPSAPERRVLDEFNIALQPGEQVALVGPSGAGKSTVLQLLQRFYAPTAGRILLDGIDLRQLALPDLRASMALVPQDPVIFAASVRDNVRYARPDASDDDVWRALTAAHAREFVSALPGGLDSYLGERGVRLSGGQKQRIAIARALLADRPVLLLDEATSALDSNSEAEVQQALNELMRSRTSLVIAHRLATVINADRILVLDQGRLVASGTHTELLQRSPLYAELAQRQLQTGAAPPA